MTEKQQIQDSLNIAAQIVRRYNLDSAEFLFSKFQDADKRQLDAAWIYGLQKIQNREIVKDVSHLTSYEEEMVIRKLSEFGNNTQTILYFLNSGFDAEKLNLSSENLQRRLRNLLAKRYLELSAREVASQSIKLRSSFRFKVASFIEKYKIVLIILGLVVAFATPRIIDGLTPVETLTIRIHERSVYRYRVGATCSDGWHSNATGRGACSHHGGVAKWIYKIAYRRTLEECRLEAQKTSWIN